MWNIVKPCPYLPCMVYFPTFIIIYHKNKNIIYLINHKNNNIHVGKHTIDGCYGQLLFVRSRGWKPKVSSFINKLFVAWAVCSEQTSNHRPQKMVVYSRTSNHVQFFSGEGLMIHCCRVSSLFTIHLTNVSFKSCHLVSNRMDQLYHQKSSTILGGGFKVFWFFNPYLGKISNLTNIFQMGGSTTK